MPLIIAVEKRTFDTTVQKRKATPYYIYEGMKNIVLLKTSTFVTDINDRGVSPMQSVGFLSEKNQRTRKGELKMKKVMCMLMAVAMCLILCVPAIAADNTPRGVNPPGEVNSLSLCNHVPGDIINVVWVTSSNFDPMVYCYYRVEQVNCKCAKCDTVYSYLTGEVQMCTQNKQYVYSGTALKGFTCTLCDYCSWKAMPDIPVVM